ncbi:MAG: hypothetical protein HUU38_11420 [Anaerolineales bacterium]|nr:hypothetical protein [Anaerolineales bacterium]
MSNLPPPTPPRNPETHAQHRRQMFWQVFFPLGVGTVIMLGACVLPVVAVARGGEVSKWANTSLIWLILPAMFFSLIPLALLGGSAYGVLKLFEKMPGWMFRLQGIFDLVRLKVREYSDKAVEPVIQAQSFNAKIQAVMPTRKPK